MRGFEWKGMVLRADDSGLEDRRVFIIPYALSFFFFQAEDGIRDSTVTGVQTCALPISPDIAVAASLMHIDAGATCNSGYAYLATNFPPSGWQCPTSVLFGEQVGISVWKPFVEEYYASHPWPAMWAPPAGVVTRQVCSYDGGYVSTGGCNASFCQGGR